MNDKKQKLLKELLGEIKDKKELTELSDLLYKQGVESLLNAELAAHLGYESRKKPVDLELTENQELNIQLFDASGKMVKNFEGMKGNKGANRFSFSSLALRQGIYIIKIDSGDQNILTDRILVVNEKQ